MLASDEKSLWKGQTVVRKDCSRKYAYSRHA